MKTATVTNQEHFRQTSRTTSWRW